MLLILLYLQSTRDCLGIGYGPVPGISDLEALCKQENSSLSDGKYTLATKTPNLVDGVKRGNPIQRELFIFSISPNPLSYHICRTPVDSTVQVPW